MDQKRFIELIKKGCVFLENDGFNFKYNDKSILYAKYDLHSYCIAFSWAEYNYILITSLNASIRFDEIETPISNILKIDKGNLYTIQKYLSKSELKDELKVDNEEKVENLIDLIKKFYNNTAVNFFDTYKSLDIICEKYKTLDREELNNFLTNSGNSLFYRELLLNSKIDKPSAQKYFEMIIKELTPLKDNEVYLKIMNNLTLINNNIQSGVL